VQPPEVVKNSVVKNSVVKEVKPNAMWHRTPQAR